MTASRAIVQRWMERKTHPIPAEALRAARLHLLDAAGVGLAAASLAQGAPYRRFAEANRAAAGGFGTLAGVKAGDPAMAALIDGGLIHSLEYDDTHTASIIHGSAVLAAAALAVGQAQEARFVEVLHAYLLGYEILIRLGLAAPGAFQQHGFQVTSVAGTLAAALVAADLMGASEDQRVHAMGVALSQSSGVFEFLTNGASVKSMHPGWAAHAGVLAAKLALAGLTGPETALEGARGLYAAFAQAPDALRRLDQSMEDFGQRWRIAEVAFKFHPCCHYLHPFIEAAGGLAAETDPDAIDSMVFRIAPGAAGIVCEPWAEKLAPKDGHAIRWSLPVVVAARLVEGRVDHDTFTRPAPPEVLALAARCRWEALTSNRFPEAFEAEIECRLRDGRVIGRRVDDVFGNVSRPASEADVLAKFRANTAATLSPDRAERLSALFVGAESVTMAAYAEAIATFGAES